MHSELALQAPLPRSRVASLANLMPPAVPLLAAASVLSPVSPPGRPKERCWACGRISSLPASLSETLAFPCSEEQLLLPLLDYPFTSGLRSLLVLVDMILFLSPNLPPGAVR